ncbi:MAG TPA: hypothetical protein VEF04_16225, partial [Blastocatellia bacterium]|nr:hypothetical protein [Blastocatellia bacterium]
MKQLNTGNLLVKGVAMKFHRSLYVISLLILLIGLTSMTNAQRRGYGQERWEYLGQSNVDGTRDQDNILVNSRDAFRAIHLRVQGAGIEFQRVVVHFENGTDTEV